MKQTLLIALTFIILTLFIFSGNILLKINESVLGKLFFVLIIILYAHEHTIYGLLIAIVFFIVNEKFTYSYYEGMQSGISNSSSEPFTYIGQETYHEQKNNTMDVKPTSAGVIELSEQLQSKNPRRTKTRKDNMNKKMAIADTDIINMISNQKSNFENIPSYLDENNLYSPE